MAKGDWDNKSMGIISAACFLLSAAVFMIATGSIAAECISKNPDYARERPKSQSFAEFNISMAAMIVIIACVIIVFGYINRGT